jgi:hypothetical protein
MLIIVICADENQAKLKGVGCSNDNTTAWCQETN